MATHSKFGYGTQGQAITLTISGVADNSARESTAIDNSSDRFLDLLIQGTITVTTAATLTTNPVVYLYAYGSNDGGTVYSGGASGSDAAFGAVPQDLDNCARLGTVACITMDEVYKSDVFSVAAAFGGIMPDSVGIILENQTGQALNTATFKYQGVYVINS